MFRTNSTFTLLQALTAVVTFAIILWFVGVPSFRAEAANVTTFSNTLSDSAPVVVSNHTLTFVTPTGLAAGETLSIDFGTTSFSGIGSLVAQDIDLNASGTERTLIDGAASGASWNVTAAVETIFDFTVTAVNSGGTVNGDTITSTSSVDAIPFGILTADEAKTAAQDLQVNTNAANGFVITVQVDQQLTSATGADIDGYVEGAFTTTPTFWSGPTPLLGDDDTYGHWGITTNDSTIYEDLGNHFDVGGSGRMYVSASTTPVEVFRNDGPADGTTDGLGLTRVGYTVEVSPLQEAGDDYTATLTYVATPVF